MTILDTEIVKKTAKLAMLELNEQQLTTIKQDLSNIFHLFHTLNRDDIRELRPLGHPLDTYQPLREDVTIERDMTENMKQNVPNLEDGFILVPKVIE